MNNKDISTKILLALFVAGIWGALLRPMVTPSSALAKTATQSVPQYTFGVITIDKDGTVPTHQLFYTEANVPDDTRFIRELDTEDLLPLITLAGKQGWRVHSIIPTREIPTSKVNPSNNGKFLVLFEK